MVERTSLNYWLFCQTPEWKKLRGIAWKKTQGHCARCGERVADGQAHHLTYDSPSVPGSKWPRGWETAYPEQVLEYLCRPCHAAAHGRPHPDSLAALHENLKKTFQPWTAKPAPAPPTETGVRHLTTEYQSDVTDEEYERLLADLADL